MMATSLDETPFFVRAGGEDIFGVLTEPTVKPLGVGAVILTGGAYVGATNRNRVSVRIARTLADRGYHAVRMDYHGVGESTGDFDSYPLHRPFAGDILPAVSMLEERGISRQVLVGTTCFGARTALHAAAHVQDLAGVALLACPIYDFPNSPIPDTVSAASYLKRLIKRSTLRELRTDPAKREEWASIARWKGRRASGKLRSLLRSGDATRDAAVSRDSMSPAFYEPLAALAARGTPVLIGYGEEDEFWPLFQAAAQSPRLSKLLGAPGSSLQVRSVRGSIHALRRISAQDTILDLTLDWLAGIGLGAP